MVGALDVDDRRRLGDLDDQPVRADRMGGEKALDVAAEAGVAHRLARDVDRQHQVASGGVAPAEVADRLPQDPLVDLVDQPEPLGVREEAPRGDQVSVGVREAEEELEAGDPGRGDRHDRLGVEDEPILVEGLKRLRALWEENHA